MPQVPCYFRDLVTDERFDLQFSPEGFETETGGTWTEQRPRGSSHPRADFDHGAGREHSLEFTWLRETADAADVEKVRRRIEAMPLASYDRDGQLTDGPHLYRFVWGAWRTLRVRITKARVTYGPAFDPETGVPLGLKAALTLVEAPTRDLGRDDILAGRS